MLSPDPQPLSPPISSTHTCLRASATPSWTSLLGDLPCFFEVGKEIGGQPGPPCRRAPYQPGQSFLPRGRFSVVRQCREKASGRVLAAKIVPYHPENRTAVLREYEALKGLRHPHLAQLQAAYLSPRHLVLILELCSGPELLPCLAER